MPIFSLVFSSFPRICFFLFDLPLHVNLEIRYDVQVPMTRRLGCWFFWKL